MGSSIETGVITVGDYCASVLVLFVSWLILLYYQSRFHQDDALTNFMCAAPSPGRPLACLFHAAVRLSHYCNRYGVNMIFVLVMSQHIADNSFNLVRFAIAAGCQRLLIFCMYLRCRVALPEKSFILSAYCTQCLFSSAMYFVFAIGIAYASPDDYAPLLGKFRYIGIIGVIELLLDFSNFSPCLTNRRLPLHVPHMMIRIGEMMLISIGEVSIAMTQYAPFS